MKYSYYMTQRPPMPGAMPKDGLDYIDEYERPQFIPEIEHTAWAKLVYNRELTKKETQNYELTPETITCQMTPRTIHLIIDALELLTNEIDEEDSVIEDACLLYGELKGLIA